MLIDTHVHYNLKPLSDEWKEHWLKAQEHGIGKSIIVGTDFFTSQAAWQIIQKESNLFASSGIHPTDFLENVLESVAEGEPSEILFRDLHFDLEDIQLLIEDPKVVAIGETGLDYFRLPKENNLRELIIQLQKKAFEEHILLAKKLKKSLIIHVRDRETPEQQTEGNAYWDALEILQKNDVKNFTLHCVSGPLSYVKVAVEMGGYMGFDGNITYPNAKHIRDIFNIVPAERRLLETDAPYLPPQEFRGQLCEPWMMSKTADFVEKELKADRESFAENAQRLFSLD